VRSARPRGRGDHYRERFGRHRRPAWSLQSGARAQEDSCRRTRPPSWRGWQRRPRGGSGTV